MIADHDHRITEEHLARMAIVYPRQSSRKQVLENTESTRIQLGLREKAVALGWRNPVVIDDDLGVSAGGFADRPGFQQMLTRVTMREVGIILCSDASRLSRNSKDWAHLFEFCGYFKVLIADLEQVYDLSRSNDRLVLGIKGAVAELEYGIIRSRLRDALEAKARRGDLRFNLPAGYVHDESGKIVFDPDKRVQQEIYTMFEQFDRATSVRQLAMWYRDTNRLFPIRLQRKGAKTNWQVPTSKTLYKLLVHPVYAGAYVHGRRVTCVEYDSGKLVKRVKERTAIEDCDVCIRDDHPAYISWDKLLANRAKILENRARWPMDDNRGAIREGLALLAGLLRCGHCGSRIYVGYKKDSALYYCDGGHEKSSKRCFSFGSKLIDRRVSEELCRALEPFAIKAAIAAADMKQEQRTQEIESATMQVDAVRYEADRAFEQFDLCDPKNRLVADSLEQRLNAKLAELQMAKDKLEELRGLQEELTEEQRQRLRELASDFPKVWNHPEADPKLKKRLLRVAILEILVKHEAEHQRLEVTVHWKGGVHTRLHVKKRPRPRGSKADPSLVEFVRQLSEQLRDADIARILNMKHVLTPRGLKWTQDRVRDFRHHHRLRAAKGERDPDQLTMNEVMRYLDVSHNAVLALEKMGAISKNQITDFAPWRVSRKELDSDRVQALVRVLKATGRLPKGGCPKNQLMFFDDEH
jgi:DNA invertase Pin-like site-specific DNA recombinase